MSTALAVVDNPRVNYRDKIETIKQTVAIGATDAQLEMFLTLCERYGLDPFLHEIWFVKGVGVMTGRDGYLKAAMRDQDYDGIVSAAVCEGDSFSMSPIIPTVTHTFGAKRGSVIGAYAVVFHKKRRPAVSYASFGEYNKGGQTWGTYKSAMICKVAEIFSLKRQFGISGLITEEETGPDHQYAEVTAISKDQAIDIPKREYTEAIPGDPLGIAGRQEEKPWRNMGELRTVFTGLKDSLSALNLGATYEGALREFGVEAPETFKDPAKALACYKALQERLLDAEAGSAQ